MKSEAVKFWSDRGHPFVKLSADECMRHVPSLGNLVYMIISYINMNYIIFVQPRILSTNVITTFFILDEHSRYGKNYTNYNQIGLFIGTRNIFPYSIILYKLWW